MGSGILDPRLADAGLAPAPDGSLAMSGVRLDEIAEAVGTPAFVYDAATMRRRYASLDQVFGAIPPGYNEDILPVTFRFSPTLNK